MDEPLNMRKMGLEPTRCNHHKILSLARLPVPTLPQAINIISVYVQIVKQKFLYIMISVTVQPFDRTIGKTRRLFF